MARIDGSSLKELVITDSIRPTEAAEKSSRIRVLTIAPLVARRSAGLRMKARSPACLTDA